MNLATTVTRAAAALLAITSLATGRTEEEGFGSNPSHEPQWITGAQLLSTVSEDGDLVGVGPLEVVPIPDDPGASLLAVDGVAIGALHDPSDDLSQYTASLLDGTSAVLQHDVDLDGYTFLLAGVPFVLDGEVDPESPSGASGDPKVKVFRIRMKRADGTVYDRGRRFRYEAPPGSTHDVKFLQFFSLLAEYGGDGWSAPLLPGDPPIAGTGNGGAPRNPATGKGYAKADGSTVYVDGTSADPHYPSSSKGNAHTASDTPGEDGDAATGQVGGIGQARENGPGGAGRAVKWVRFTHDLTMYLLLDGKVAWRVDWTWTVTYAYPPLVGARPTSRSGGTKPGGSRAASELDPKHKEALAKFKTGDYSGATL